MWLPFDTFLIVGVTYPRICQCFCLQQWNQDFFFDAVHQEGKKEVEEEEEEKNIFVVLNICFILSTKFYD